MGFKEKPYWLRGGIILGVIGIFIAFITVLNDMIGHNVSFLSKFFWDLPFTDFLTRIDAIEIVVLVIFHTLPYIIIGIILGWIYGKIKGRNQTQPNQGVQNDKANN